MSLSLSNCCQQPAFKRVRRFSHHEAARPSAPAISSLMLLTSHHSQTSHFTTHISHFTPQVSHFTPHISHFTPHISHFTPQISHFTPQISHFSPQISHFTPHISHFTSQIPLKSEMIFPSVRSSLALEDNLCSDMAVLQAAKTSTLSD